VNPNCGDLAEAESSLLVHLELYAWLGSKEGMAAAYVNLGALYQTIGDLAPAEAMYKEALELYDALDRREAMADDYGNLGRVNNTRGDVAKAAAIYAKSITLFNQLGATTQVQQVEELLDNLKVTHARPSEGK